MFLAHFQLICKGEEAKGKVSENYFTAKKNYFTAKKNFTAKEPRSSVTTTEPEFLNF
jgi:hypothetical protein